MDLSPANAANIDAYSQLDDDSLVAFDPEGDPGRKYLLNPTIFRMLGPLPGQRILDAGCGQGYLSRLMATAGAKVSGVEPASQLVGYARRSEQNRPLGIEYLQRDLSRLGTIEGGGFDAVVANMVLLNIADWETAMSNCVGVLRAGGQFVFSLLHPCWAPDALATWADRGVVELAEYLQTHEVQLPHGVNFHRPLNAYLNCALRLGGTIDEIAEPAVPAGARSQGLSDIAAHIPNYIVVSLRFEPSAA